MLRVLALCPCWPGHCAVMPLLNSRYIVDHSVYDLPCPLLITHTIWPAYLSAILTNAIIDSFSASFLFPLFYPLSTISLGNFTYIPSLMSPGIMHVSCMYMCWMCANMFYPRIPVGIHLLAPLILSSSLVPSLFYLYLSPLLAPSRWVPPMSWGSAQGVLLL